MKQRGDLGGTNVETRLRIARAEADLLSEARFEDLTIDQICKRAKVSRSTFYYHFDDKFDVVQWHYDYVAQRYLAETGRTLTWMQALYRNTHEVLKLRELYLGAFATRGYQSLFSYSKRRRIETLRETLRDYHHVEVDEELEFQLFALAESEVACISRWFKEGMPYDLEQLCLYLVGIVPPRLFSILDNPVDPLKY